MGCGASSPLDSREMKVRAHIMKGALIVDSRVPTDYIAGHVDGAVSIPKLPGVIGSAVGAAAGMVRLGMVSSGYGIVRPVPAGLQNYEPRK